jgi:hypothetical protein
MSSTDNVPNIVKRYSRDKRTFNPAPQPAAAAASVAEIPAVGARAPQGVSCSIVEDLIPEVPQPNADPFHSLLKPNYVKPLTEKEQKEIEKKQRAADRAEKARQKLMATKQPPVHQQLDAHAAHDTADSEILGKNRRQLLMRIQKYKQTFKENKVLQDLKIKKNATEAELQLYIEECQSIVECSAGGSDELVIKMILGGIKFVEGTTHHSQKYNLVGISAALQENPDFTQCCRELYLKYGGDFHYVPPE